MKVTNTSFTDFLKKAGCFEIPAFQRNYVWSLKQWQQLFDDVLSLSRYEKMKKHFLGTVVYEPTNLVQISKTNIVRLIDGQQRIITLSLLLAALQNLMYEENDEDSISLGEEIRSLLFNNDKDCPYKIMLNSNDEEVYSSLLDGEDNLKTDALIFKAYEFFKNQIKSTKVLPCVLFETIKKLEIVDMALESEVDNSQLIFDSLNSTGVRLSQVDQIKNFILLGTTGEEQDELFEKYWSPMVQSFDSVGCGNRLSDFIRDYLTIQNNGSIPKEEAVYEEFCRFFMNRLKLQSRSTVVKHLVKYSKYYVKLISATLRDKDVRMHIQAINDIDAKDAYPFLMEVFEDFESELIDKEILLEILSTVENFVANRDKLIHPEKTFVTLSNDVNQMLALKHFTPKIVKNSKKMTINDLLDEGENENLSA